MSDETDFINRWSQWQQSLLDESFANMRRMSALPFLQEKQKKVRKGVTPHEVVYEEDQIKVLHYLGEGPVRHKTPLLFVFAMVNRPYIVDLKKGRSVVAHFVDRGFDTYLLDWGIPTDAEQFLTIDDYLNGYLRNVIDFLCERTGADQATLLGYCMGGAMSTMFTALHQEKVKNLILLASGLDYTQKEGLIATWADPAYFDVDKFVDTMGNVPAEFLQTGFLMLKPVANLVEKPINFLENVDNDAFVEDFLTMEAWINDNVPVPGEVFRDYAKYLFQQNLLVQNKFPVGKHIVDLKKISCPLLNLMARNDDLVPCSQSASINDLVSSTDRKSIIVPSGHIGLAIGRRSQTGLWPDVCEWLAERSEPA